MARDLWCTWKPGLRCEIIALEASSDWARATTASKRQGMKLWNNATLAIQEKELPCLWRPILPWHPTLKPSTSYVASPTNQGFHYSNPCLSQRSTLSHSNSNEKKMVSSFLLGDLCWKKLDEGAEWQVGTNRKTCSDSGSSVTRQFPTSPRLKTNSLLWKITI